MPLKVAILLQSNRRETLLVSTTRHLHDIRARLIDRIPE